MVQIAPRRDANTGTRIPIGVGFVVVGTGVVFEAVNTVVVTVVGLVVGGWVGVVVTGRCLKV